MPALKPVIAAEVTVTAITLNGGTNPSVLAKPTEIELTHNLATFEPLSLVSPPSGTYTGATLSFRIRKLLWLTHNKSDHQINGHPGHFHGKRSVQPVYYDWTGRDCLEL